MNAEYKIKLEFTANYKNVDIAEIKGGHAMGEDIAQLICDEIAMAGGVGGYEILSSELNLSKCK